MGQRKDTENFLFLVNFAYFLLLCKNGYSCRVLVKNISLWLCLLSFWAKICKYFCKMVMRKAKNCQNFRYAKNRHFEFFFKNFFGKFFCVIYIEILILINFLYDNFQNFSVMLMVIIDKAFYCKTSYIRAGLVLHPMVPKEYCLDSRNLVSKLNTYFIYTQWQKNSCLTFGSFENLCHHF